MNESIDTTLIDGKSNVEYAGFWYRLGALIIDALIFIPVGIILMMMNSSQQGMMQTQLIIAALTLLYKPIMEFHYGATIGKMALSIKVTNLEHEAPSLKEVLLRNIFHISSNISTIFFMLMMIMTGELMRSVFDFNSQHIPGPYESAMGGVGLIFGLISIAEFIVLLSDSKSRAIHDMIGKTYVIKAEK